MLTERQFEIWQKYVELLLEISLIYSVILTVFFFPFAFLFENVYKFGLKVLLFFAALILINTAIEIWKPWLNAVSYSEYLRRRKEVLLTVHCKG